MKQKSKEFKDKSNKNNILKFVLNKYDEKENKDKDDISIKYKLLKKLLNDKIQNKEIKKYNNNIINNINLRQNIKKKYYNNIKNRNNNLFSFSTDNITKIFNSNNNNITSSKIKNSPIKKRQNSFTNLRNQIKKINNQISLSLKNEKIHNFNSFNKNISLPLND